MFKLYDKVLLKDGRTASIVEFLGDGCVVDIDMDGDYDTVIINLDEIDKTIN